MYFDHHALHKEQAMERDKGEGPRKQEPLPLLLKNERLSEMSEYSWILYKTLNSQWFSLCFLFPRIWFAHVCSSNSPLNSPRLRRTASASPLKRKIPLPRWNPSPSFLTSTFQHFVLNDFHTDCSTRVLPHGTSPYIQTGPCFWPTLQLQTQHEAHQSFHAIRQQF